MWCCVLTFYQQCLTDVCAELAYLNANSDVYLGYTGWSAGAFGPTYELLEVPSGSNGSWVDQEIVTQCIVGTRSNTTAVVSSTVAAASTLATAAPSSSPAAIRNVTSENATYSNKGLKTPEFKLRSDKSGRRATRKFS